jgi:hypothetical protein
MQTTRRNLLQFVGGSAVGALFTPAPWRLITDAALWSENWPGIPQPARGEIRTCFNHCSLCPAGCAVRARCVGEQPVSLAGVKDHPLSHGTLCPWGVAAHQVAYHPARLRSGPAEIAVAAVREATAKCAPNERVAILDLRPGRTASWTYRRAMAALPGGVYIATPEPEWGFDLAAARTVLSLGVPLADGWGTPGNVFAARDRFRLIQADAVETRTVAIADQWLPVRAGSEGALARAVAGEIAPAEVSRATGLAEDVIRAVLDELHGNGPSLVLGDMPETIRANEGLGAFGKTVVARRETPVPQAWTSSPSVTALEDVPDRSLRVLLIDETGAVGRIPWAAIEPKLAADALVVAFGWTADGYGRHARFTLPAPVYGDGTTAAFRLATPWTMAPAGIVNPAEFVAKFAGITADNAVHERADAIHVAGRGQVYTPADAKTAALKDISADDFWKALNAGACWMDERVSGPQAGKLKHAPPVGHALACPGPLAVVSAESLGPAAASPLTSKLYRESNLRQAADRIVLAPSTARACGVSDGGRAVLETGRARIPVIVSVDAGLPPDVVRVATRNCAVGARGKVVPA